MKITVRRMRRQPSSSSLMEKFRHVAALIFQGVILDHIPQRRLAPLVVVVDERLCNRKNAN